MKKTTVIALLVTAIVTTTTIVAQKSNPILTKSFLESMNGNWVGKLTYTDYQDDKTQVTMDVWLQNSMEGEYLIKRFFFIEPDGKTKQEAKSKDTTYLLKGGKQLFESGYKHPWKIQSYVNTNDKQVLVIVTNDDDNDKPSLIKTTITITPTTFIVKKEIKYNGSKLFLTRHTFYYSKQIPLK